ncbi:vegetative incompatibility protein HET-E-1 [Achaetomium macrosporum]|uniref:Vegetative incompatibility protein HET-E-1 n=1 Tax=Achaetomium macrosporum TaxID=79813 RepID=A0AAN7C618_9PEZI|nr:vegetative incompatibility protein HET-E-1 [Achaetomium macrosporum]
MRLLKTRDLDFEEFENDQNRPPYAILSHTWEADEVTFAHHVSRQDPSKAGYAKIRGCCRFAESEGFNYVWIDSCCIDKSSSAELSEAINSMFQWYRNAAICYAYLSDVHVLEDPAGEMPAFSASRWFTRGWTLQELLAPAELVFLASDWTEIGTKTSLARTVSRITRIDEKVLMEGNWAGYSVAQKMSWAAGRETTRPEDEAYCLMGLFDVNMPLLYGEGRKAFLRLQQEILRVSDDQSIFAWWYHNKGEPTALQTSGLMASSPNLFRHAPRVQRLHFDASHESIFEVVNQLVRMTLPVIDQVRGLKLLSLPTQPPTHHILEVQSDNHEGKAMEDGISAPLFHQSGSERGSTPTPESDTESLVATTPISLMGPADWWFYIYEPVVIVPLRCHIDGNQLGILLSRGPVGHFGPKTLLRVHRPSLVTLNRTLASDLWMPVTKYGSISGHSRLDTIGSRQPQPFRWPEIRVAGLLSNGYVVDDYYMMGWVFDKTRSAYIPDLGAQTKVFKPFVLAFHKTRNDAAHPVFAFNIIQHERDSLRCHVEIYSDDMSRILEYDKYSFDLGQMRRAQVSLGNGSGVVAVYREATTGAFVSLSIEPLANNRFLVEVLATEEQTAVPQRPKNEDFVGAYTSRKVKDVGAQRPGDD